ncbi:TIGD3 protein, partial [Rhinopomastus cyanomelas]|nr:TIGD3 protein [Rhinopomastus cyanomelas]
MLEGPKVSQNELAKRFGVSQPQICRIIKNKERILSEWHRNGHPERKRKREGQDAAALEAALLRWVEGAHASDLSASGGHLSKALGQPDPDSDPGWLSRFETRCNPPFKKPPAANGNAEQPPAERWAGTVLPGLLRCYAPAEIYGCGETDTVLPAGSDGSTRLTLLLCANADGSEKIPLRVVGENPWPRCLQGVNLPQMPWSYRAEGSAAEGMSATLFAEWLRDLDEGMRQRRKSVVLLLAEHEAHPYVRLTNVRLVFVPPSATLAQPLACGVTGDLKGHYRRRLLRWVPPERGREQPTLLDALHMLAQAWGDVRPGLIASCFRAAGFSPDVGTEALSREQLERRVLTEWDPEHDRELAEMDEGTAGHEGTGELAVRPCPSQREVWSSLATLRRYLECRVTSPHLFQAFYELEDVVHTVA